MGSAPSLKGEKLGKWIDSHDIVVRFNGAPVKGHESDVGTKTSIVVTNPYPEGRPSLDFDGHVVLISPQTRRYSSLELAEWLNGHKVLATYAPDLVMVGDVDHKAGLTTGTYGIHLLSRLLKPSKIAVTGFTMFLGDESSHYWDSLTPSGMHKHDVKFEAVILIKIINALKMQIEVTSDIMWVSKRVSYDLNTSILLHRLNNERWLV